MAMEHSSAPSRAALLRTPRWIALTFIAILATAVCLFFAWWQGTRTRDIVEAERASLSAAVVIEQAISANGDVPNSSIGRPVIMSGSYVGAQQRFVANRLAPDGQTPGYWVVTPLQVDEWVVPVVRGWVDSTESPAAAVTSDPVVVQGRIQPYERFYIDGTQQADGTWLAITDGVARTSADVIGGFVTLTAQTPLFEPAPEVVTPVVNTADVPFPIQNAFYTLQWVLFAAVVWFMWGRWLGLDVRRAREQFTEMAVDGSADSLRS
jgi:cytochrome oxidase assembly protein ShyY1